MDEGSSSMTKNARHWSKAQSVTGIKMSRGVNIVNPGSWVKALNATYTGEFLIASMLGEAKGSMPKDSNLKTGQLSWVA